MADREKIILIPRYTSFVGLGTFYTPPIRVRDYCRADVTFWRGAGFGTNMTLYAVIDGSPDLSVWSTLANFQTTPDSEHTVSMDLTTDWIRAGVIVAYGSDVAFSGWMVGNFERREEPTARA